ncbi:MAG: peptidoglycan-binding protein [Thiotrichaceae bacterium]|nr:peptidoglycan-binding protein [Thiotrichaceae bacterium]
MYTNPRLSLAAAVVAGMFVTGCSQQQVNGGSTSPSQVAGSSQQVAGSSSQQVAGSSSQQAGSSQQQQAEPAPVVVTRPVTRTPAPAPPPRHVSRPKHVKVVKRNPNKHRHPAVPRCTKSVDHVHKSGAKHHNHKYSCKGATRPAVKRPAYRRPVQKRPTANRWTHRHPAIPRCTKSVTHTHKFGTRNHTHKYSCRKGAPAPVHRTTRPARPATRPGNRVNVHALQRKLKAKGYYRGPINGVVTPDTRSALQRYMKTK